MGGPSRTTIWGPRVAGAKIRAESAREAAKKAQQEAAAAECELWSARMEGFGGPAQPSPTISQCLIGGYGWLEVKCHRCETTVSIPLAHVRRRPDTEIWKLESAFRCRSCSTNRYRPPVYLIKLTKEREIARYVWHHPSEGDGH